MSNQQPLNPKLLKRLQLAAMRGVRNNGLDGGNVIIAKHGQPMQSTYRNGFNERTGKLAMQMDISDFGESYRVCCPYCNDTRHRLYVSHRWGVFDPVTKLKNTGLWHCYNEQCEKNADFYNYMIPRIEDDITNYTRPGGRPPPPLMPSVSPGSQAAHAFVRSPGNTVRLSELADEHEAIKYLKERGISARKLEKYFKAAYCSHSFDPMVRNRLIIPIFSDGVLKGWQARYLGDCTNLWRCSNSKCQHEWYSDEKPDFCPVCDNKSYTPRRVPKWYTSPGTKLGDLLLNFDVARSWDYGVVVEGPFDVIKPGSPKASCVPGPIIGTFGNKITNQQHLMLNSAFRYKTLYLALDPEEFEARTMKIYKTIAGNYDGAVVPVPMPKGTDPGSLPHKDFWNYVRDAGKTFNARYLPE